MERARIPSASSRWPHVSSERRAWRRTMNISNEAATLDKQVRYRIYDYVMRQGLIPTLTQTSDALGWSNEETAASFQRLADAHMLVLQKGTGEILMANPFSAVPTPFPV